MKDKINKEPENAVVAASITPVITTRKRRTSLVNHIPMYTPPTFKIQSTLEEVYKSFLATLANYEQTTPPNSRDPYIQWIINNKRFVIKDRFNKLTSKLLELHKKNGAFKHL